MPGTRELAVSRWYTANFVPGMKLSEAIVWCSFPPSCQSMYLGWVPTNTREASVLADWALTSLASISLWHVSPMARKKVLLYKRWILQFLLVRQDSEINTIHRCRSRGPALGFYLCAYKVSSQLSIIPFAAISLCLRGSGFVYECTEANAAIIFSLEGQDEGPSWWKVVKGESDQDQRQS